MHVVLVSSPIENLFTLTVSTFVEEEEENPEEHMIGLKDAKDVTDFPVDDILEDEMKGTDDEPDVPVGYSLGDEQRDHEATALRPSNYPGDHRTLLQVLA